MKVLNVVKYYHPSTGGMETYVKQLSDGIAAQGIESTVLTINHVPCFRTQTEVVGKVPVRRVACQGKVLSQPVSLTFGRELRQQMAHVDVVHLHCPFPNAERFGATFRTKPLIITWCADPANTRWKHIFPLFRPHLLRLLDMARRVVLIGPNLLENSPTLRPYESKCEVIPLAYSKRTGQESAPKAIRSSNLALLFVGKLRAYKGVEYLIRALVDTPAVVLRVVGDGEERARLEKLSSKIGVASRVTFMGNVPNETLNREYRRADLFVLPSIDASEAFGIVQAEAMSFGLPVINTNVRSSVPFVSLDGTSGVTVPPKDSAGLAAAIRRFSDECGFYEKCSRNAIMRARLFSEDNMINSYVQIYKKCFDA